MRLGLGVIAVLAIAIGLYTALSPGANTPAPAMASAPLDTTKLENLREGTMKKLRFGAPAAISQTTFTDPDGGQYQLSKFQGKHVVLNFWATWCAPCRKEMPMLAELQDEFGGDGFEVVTIATGRNELPAIRKFFRDIGVTNLPLYLDPKQALGRDVGVLGLPVTLILNPEGDEIARMTGDAEWNGDSAKAIIKELLAPSS